MNMILPLKLVDSGGGAQTYIQVFLPEGSNSHSSIPPRRLKLTIRQSSAKAQTHNQAILHEGSNSTFRQSSPKAQMHIQAILPARRRLKLLPENDIWGGGGTLQSISIKGGTILVFFYWDSHITTIMEFVQTEAGCQLISTNLHGIECPQHQGKDKPVRSSRIHCHGDVVCRVAHLCWVPVEPEEDTAREEGQ